jgi:hypothetical protein
MNQAIVIVDSEGNDGTVVCHPARFNHIRGRSGSRACIGCE